MELLFFGTPPFAVPTLDALHAAGHSIKSVITRPDKRRGRSGKPTPTAVKEAALGLGLDVRQPPSVNAPEAVAELEARQAELAVVVAYGEILRPEVLATTERGFINLHASLLPRYRGAAPINWAIINGEETTGVSVIWMMPKMDAGPILDQREVTIGEHGTAGELADRLAEVGAQAVADVVGRLDAGEDIPGQPQPDEPAPFAPKLSKKNGRVDWSLPADRIRNLVRGLTPWPGAYCDLRTQDRTQRVTLIEVRTGPDATEEADKWEPGTVVRVDDGQGITVRAGQGSVIIRRLRPAGSRAMDAGDFIHGHDIRPGDRFC